MQAVMVALVTCKKKKDPLFINEGTREVTKFFPCKSIGSFSSRSRAANSAVRSQIWSKFKLTPAFMVIPVTCKNEEDTIRLKALE